MVYRLIIETLASTAKIVEYLTSLVEEAECLFRLRDLSYQPGIKFKLERISDVEVMLLVTSNQLYSELLNPLPPSEKCDVDWSSTSYLHVNRLSLKPLEGIIPTFRVPS